MLRVEHLRDSVIKRIARSLGVTRHEAIGIVTVAVVVWSDKADDRHGVPFIDAQCLADDLEYEGDAERLLHALTEPGRLLTLEDGRLVWTNWPHWEPKWARDARVKREARAQAAAPARAEEDDDADNGAPRRAAARHGAPRRPLSSSSSSSSSSPEENPPVTAGAVTSPSDADASPGEARALGGRGPVGFRFSEPEGESDPDAAPSGVKADRGWTGKRSVIAAIYAAYPRKRSPEKARRAIEQAVRRVAQRDRSSLPDAAAWLLARTRAFAASPLATTTPSEFLKYPQGWFSGGCYDEPDAEWAVPRGTPPGQEARAGPGVPGSGAGPGPGAGAQGASDWRAERHEAARRVRAAVGLD